MEETMNKCRYKSYERDLYTETIYEQRASDTGIKV